MVMKLFLQNRAELFLEAEWDSFL